KPRATGTPVLELRNASISYFTRAGAINVVPDISFVLQQGEALGLVGESGCGKSTVAFAVMNYHGGPRPARHPRRPDGDGLPGSDEQPEPGDAGRPSADGGADRPPGRQRGRCAAARAQHAGRGQPARPRERIRPLSPPDVGRPAAAR